VIGNHEAVAHRLLSSLSSALALYAHALRTHYARLCYPRTFCIGIRGGAARPHRQKVTAIAGRLQSFCLLGEENSYQLALWRRRSHGEA